MVFVFVLCLSINDTMDVNLRKLQETVEDGGRGGWRAMVHEVMKSQT